LIVFLSRFHPHEEATIGSKSLMLYRAPRLSACHCWLEVDLCVPHSVIGWTLIGGGWHQARHVFWHQVSDADLLPEVDAKLFFEERRKRWTTDTDGVGFLTGCSLAEFVEVRQHRDKLSVRCIATIGLRNALRIGDPPGDTAFSPGTINILLQISQPLSECASIEALSLVTEARTAAVLDGHVPSSIGTKIATGTGTDCIVLASPSRSTDDTTHVYAGKHTELGHLIGSCVYDAVNRGIHQSKQGSEQNAL
jgi:adenosylcobinamide amidohydrolase